MRVLILDDEPLIAMDLEDIVERAGAECVVASSAKDAMARLAEGVDFALLDFNLGRPDHNSLPVALQLAARGIPFCFVSGSLAELPTRFRDVPRIAKPFRPNEIEAVLPKAA